MSNTVKSCISLLFLCSAAVYGSDIDHGWRYLHTEFLTTSDTSDLKQSMPWEFGVTGSLLFSSVEGDLTEEYSYVPDFSAGFYGTMEIFYPLGLRTELYYAGLGTGFATIADSKLHFNYLVTSAMFTYEFSPGLIFSVGPYIGVLLVAKDEGDDFKEDITDLVNGLDVGVKIGISYEISEMVEISGYFTRGFINTQHGERVSKFKQYNQSIMFTTSLNLTRMLGK